ncbi:hypothetical protein PHYPSEUDO_009756 [Phytophthora pseudosyringae]|uniref:VLIG-type G domain-containing protein n=1 Tax=Phytophthora pseudosyringae TaxID=221518 RepID=A0A8T1VBI2_9STRA|nr:hypothetical protein PHYPSEUDO_009756 [Phytophthora pseudosyringae]
MKEARARFDEFLCFLDEHDVPNELDDQTATALRMPERMQTKMLPLHDAFIDNSSSFNAILNEIVDGTPAGDSDSQAGLWEYVGGVARRIKNWGTLSGDDPFSFNFREAMEPRLTRLQRCWIDAVERALSKLEVAIGGHRLIQSRRDRETQLHKDQEAAKDEAYEKLRTFLADSRDRVLSAKISTIRFNHECSAASIKWTEEAEKEPTRTVHVYQLSKDSRIHVTLLGKMEFAPGVEVRQLAAVKTCQVVAVVVREGKTVIRKSQFPAQVDTVEEVEAEEAQVRTFPNACLLCSIRAKDRRVAFTFGAEGGRLGRVALYRFNESFSSLEAMRNIDMDTTFCLRAPFVDVLLTERSLCALDASGDLQSFDMRTRQTSTKVSLGSSADKKGWVGGLMCFTDELVLSRADINDGKQLCIDSMSSEDHRKLPSAVMTDAVVDGPVAVGCVDDVLYVVNPRNGVIYAAELRVTVRSDAYRIQRSGKNARQGSPRLHQHGGEEDPTEHWLRVFFHVFEKFPARSLVDDALSPQVSCSVALAIVVTENQQEKTPESDVAQVCREFFGHLMTDLRRLNKPLAGLELGKTLTCSTCLETRSVRRVLLSIVSFVPVQICRAEDNTLKLLQDGEDTAITSNGDIASDSSDSVGTEASEIAQTIRFGLLSPLLESWGGRCVVVTSMGKQSTGKSYFLNHLTGTTFAISGSRCTDGAWMSLRFLSTDMLLVVLDFEGLGLFERSEQEDIFLSVLNASVSMFTVFRMESRFDKDIDGLFSRFQKGVQLIKNDLRLFRGLLFMSVKDVNMNDRQGAVDELAVKLNAIFESSREQNFLTEMYAGQVVINCTPPFGTVEYYQSMENDAAKTLLSIVAEAATGFSTGKAFLDCLRIVLAKISFWTGRAWTKARRTWCSRISNNDFLEFFALGATCRSL